MIYFIQEGRSGNIKIGYSQDVSSRLRKLQTANSSQLAILGVVEGSPKEEAEIQGKFSKFQIRGEWHVPDLEILDFIRLNKIQSRNLVSRVEGGGYRLTFANPKRLTMEELLVMGQHNIVIVSDSACDFILGVEGKAETLLSWMRSIEGVHQKTIDQVSEYMSWLSM